MSNARKSLYSCSTDITASTHPSVQITRRCNIVSYDHMDSSTVNMLGNVLGCVIAIALILLA
jgi:hypothetical protein